MIFGKDRPTTYNIAASVYQVKPDKDGNRWVTDAQHVAVKRALEGLQRKGLIIGFRTGLAGDPDAGDGSTELCHHWMTEKRLAKWLSETKRSIDHTRSHGMNPKYEIALCDRIVRKAKAIGMKVDWKMTNNPEDHHRASRLLKV